MTEFSATVLLLHHCALPTHLRRAFPKVCGVRLIALENRSACGERGVRFEIIPGGLLEQFLLIREIEIHFAVLPLVRNG